MTYLVPVLGRFCSLPGRAPGGCFRFPVAEAVAVAVVDAVAVAVAVVGGDAVIVVDGDAVAVAVVDARAYGFTKVC